MDYCKAPNVPFGCPPMNKQTDDTDRVETPIVDLNNI